MPAGIHEVRRFECIMSAIERRLKELGIELPSAQPAVANYLGTKRSGDWLFVSARVSERRGAVGEDLTTQEAYDAARETMLHILAIVREDIDLDEIASVDKMIGFVRSAPTFVDQPKVIDGASDVLLEIFGEPGRHARTATGVAQLPYGAAVQLELVMRLRAES